MSSHTTNSLLLSHVVSLQRYSFSRKWLVWAIEFHQTFCWPYTYWWRNSLPMCEQPHSNARVTGSSLLWGYTERYEHRSLLPYEKYNSVQYGLHLCLKLFHAIQRIFTCIRSLGLHCSQAWYLFVTTYAINVRNTLGKRQDTRVPVNFLDPVQWSVLCPANIWGQHWEVKLIHSSMFPFSCYDLTLLSDYILWSRLYHSSFRFQFCLFRHFIYSPCPKSCWQSQ